MKKIGIIGGAGPLASALFYEAFIYESYLQASQIPEIVLINYPFTRGLTTLEGQSHATILQREVSMCVETLLKQQVQIGVITCNTLHLYLDPQLKGSLSFFSLPKEILAEAKRNGHTRLLVLGTQNACRSQLYCSNPDITIFYPLKRHSKLLHSIIDRVLEGKILQEDAHQMGEIIKDLSAYFDFDGVVLGCTDLPVLHHHFPISSEKPLYDSIKLPAKLLRSHL